MPPMYSWISGSIKLPTVWGGGGEKGPQPISRHHDVFQSDRASLPPRMTHDTPCQLLLPLGSSLWADTALLPERENKGPSSTNLQTLLLMCPAPSSHWPRHKEEHARFMESYLLCQVLTLKGKQWDQVQEMPHL